MTEQNENPATRNEVIINAGQRMGEKLLQGDFIGSYNDADTIVEAARGASHETQELAVKALEGAFSKLEPSEGNESSK